MERLAFSEDQRMEIANNYYGDSEPDLYKSGDDYHSYHYSNKELQMYEKLLLIARTCYFSKEEQEKLKLVPLEPLGSYTIDLLNYYVNYRPSCLGDSYWTEICFAFASLGFLRPYTDVRDINWAEVDYAFKYIVDHYADPELDTAENLTIGHLHPWNHDEYEISIPELTIATFARLHRYLTAFNNEWEFAPNIYKTTYTTGDFSNWLLGNVSLCQKISRTETLINIDKIYRGAPVTVTF